MDRFIGNTGVIVIAATNRLEILDCALLRPGRSFILKASKTLIKEGAIGRVVERVGFIPNLVTIINIALIALFREKLNQWRSSGRRRRSSVVSQERKPL
ncbi:uncharacterized protein LOC130940039 [Arachis stenosperma]|uniref:uncharacterized protein LOC130940039 n=1 Tax=Arachis stenosperma TaxID=217475 RepID=UPI0025ACE2BA|nr:uncharacterized protein LOC130940039 [Arachis stenosperma]